jgi:hypothetical protein
MPRFQFLKRLVCDQFEFRHSDTSLDKEFRQGENI